ncbi:hypothetical protein THAOC_06817 [Thalassiosira oceanica]|uniref:Uncharacterized protein n=1 Tax=Thalassiosira oceanica TaxID=159749 RepID=K0TLC0_THAOC|nr:hypothetical protein THAOC_06817 [Thalassiosira oceanica]|eukprot:EJK71717.1 hypothetical protein THAOC_06817 [Thalassiosira oceanica]
MHSCLVAFLIFDFTPNKLVEGQTRPQHQQVMVQLGPALALVPREHGLLLVGRTLEYPPRRLLRHGQAVEGGVFLGAERLARGPGLAKFTGLQKSGEVAEDVDAGQGGLDRGDPLPLGSAASTLHAFDVSCVPPPGLFAPPVVFAWLVFVLRSSLVQEFRLKRQKTCRGRIRGLLLRHKTPRREFDAPERGCELPRPKPAQLDHPGLSMTRPAHSLRGWGHSGVSPYLIARPGVTAETAIGSTMYEVSSAIPEPPPALPPPQSSRQGIPVDESMRLQGSGRPRRAAATIGVPHLATSSHLPWSTAGGVRSASVGPGEPASGGGTPGS